MDALERMDVAEIERDAIETIYNRLREKVARFGWSDTQEQSWADAVAAYRRRREANS